MVDNAVGALSRAFKILLALIQAHILLARAEAKRDSARVMAGVVLIGVSILCFVQVFLLAHVLAILALRAVPLAWPAAVGVVTGADLLLGIVLALAGRGRLDQPVMVETRELLRKTAETALS